MEEDVPLSSEDQERLGRLAGESWEVLSPGA